MTYSITNTPDIEPIDLDDMKNYLKVDLTDDDELIVVLIEAARQEVEALYGFALITQTVKVVYDSWNEFGELPLSNATSVTSVKYYDSDNTQQTWSSSNYIVDTDGEPNCISKKTDVAFPALYNRPSPIEVIYTAGFGSNTTDVPHHLKIPIYKIVADWYDRREDKPWERVSASRYLVRKNMICLL